MDIMETWSWEWGSISYGVNWNELANEFTGQDGERTRITKKKKKANPWRENLGTQKRIKKEKKKELHGLKSQNPNIRPPPPRTASHEIESPAVTSLRKSPTPHHPGTGEASWRTLSLAVRISHQAKDVGYTVPPIFSIHLVSIHTHTPPSAMAAPPGRALTQVTTSGSD